MFELFDYQEKLVSEAHEAFKQHRGVLIQSPAGSGKSIVIAEIVKQTINHGGTVLFLVGRVILAEQIISTFKRHNVNMGQCTVTTVGKAVNRLKMLTVPTLIVVDESHHAVAGSYQKVFDYFKRSFRIGFTATPWRLSGAGFEKTYGKLICGPTIDWLIKNNHLSPERLYAPETLIDDSKLKKTATGDYANKSINDAIKTGLLSSVVNNYKNLVDGQRAILYAHNVEYSRYFADQFNKNGIPAAHMDAKTPKKQREQLIDDFKNDRLKVICNVDLISEGFDVPDCSAVFLCRPTQSLVLYIQQSMRCMRYQPGKRATIIDQVGNFKRFGFPEDPREWTLSARKRKSNTGDDQAIYVCDECLGVFREWTDDNRCPYCGAPKPQRVIKKEQAQKQVLQDKIAEVKRAQTDIKDNMTLVEITEIYRARGYKNAFRRAVHNVKHVTLQQKRDACKKYGYKMFYVNKLFNGGFK